MIINNDYNETFYIDLRILPYINQYTSKCQTLN